MYPCLSYSALHFPYLDLMKGEFGICMNNFPASREPYWTKQVTTDIGTWSENNLNVSQAMIKLSGLKFVLFQLKWLALCSFFFIKQASLCPFHCWFSHEGPSTQASFCSPGLRVCWTGQGIFISGPLQKNRQPVTSQVFNWLPSIC